jgi:O-antigen ligase
MFKQIFHEEHFLPFIVFLPIFGRSFFPTVRDTSSITFQSSLTDPQILGMYLLWAYCLYCFARTPYTLKYLFTSPLWPLTLFTMVAAASAIVVSNSLMYSLWRSIETCGVLLWGVLVFAHWKNEQSPARLFVWFYAMTAIMFLGVVVAIIIDPQHAWMQEDNGVQRLATTSTFMMGANSIGVSAALLSLSALSRFMLFIQIRYLALFGAFLTLCYAARSRTGFIVFILGAFVLMIFLLRTSNRRWFTCISGMLLGTIVVGLIVVSQEFADGVMQTFTRGHNETNIKSLDGRVSIWTAAMKAFELSPILGSGYATYPMRMEASGHFHNMFIELAVTTGMLGLIPILILLGALVTRLGKLFSRHLNGAVPQQLVSLDALLLGTVLIVSEMTTAGAAYYSWQMIGIVILAIGVRTLQDGQTTTSPDGDCVVETTPMYRPLTAESELASFESSRKPIIL